MTPVFGQGTLAMGQYRLTLYPSSSDAGKGQYISGGPLCQGGIDLGSSIGRFVSDLKWLLQMQPQMYVTFKVTLGAGLNIERLRGKVVKYQAGRETFSVRIPDSVIDDISSNGTQYEITSNLRLAHFLAQCGVETSFKHTIEDMHYTTVKGLFNVKGWKTRFEDFGQDPKDYLYDKKHPENFDKTKLPNFVYGSDRILGNKKKSAKDRCEDMETDDRQCVAKTFMSTDGKSRTDYYLTGKGGYSTLGRGYLQITGKDNYKKINDDLHNRFHIEGDLTKNPDLAATKFPLLTAVSFFSINEIWTVCDEGSTAEVVKKVTRKINAGLQHLSKRKALFAAYYEILS